MENYTGMQNLIVYGGVSRRFGIQSPSILAIFLMLFPPTVTTSFLHHL